MRLEIANRSRALTAGSALSSRLSEARESTAAAMSVMAVQVALFLLALWAGWHFYTATETLAALKWGLSAAVLAIIATQLKMALMPALQANRILLAIRRLELRLAAGG